MRKFAVVPVLTAVALLLGVTGWLVLTACLIAAVAVAFYGSPWAYTFATLIVGLAYVIIAAATGMFGVRALRNSDRQIVSMIASSRIAPGGQ